MDDRPAVQLRNVSKEFSPGVRAVDGVDFDIPSGKVLALLGSSGCGKTTTLRLINRLEEPTAGAVFLRGHDVRQQNPDILRRSIGYVIQEGGLFPHLNVTANVATVPKLLGWSREKIRNRVAEVLNLVGLAEGDFGRRMPSQLSGGQRQRVGVARALAADPDILLMDEPFGALDPGTREGLQDEFLALQEKLRKTVVIVTHDIAEAGKLADSVVLMDRGRVVHQGSMRELLLHNDAGGFLGTQRKEMALEALRLRHILDGLRSVPASDEVIPLESRMKLGQVLLALARAPVNATVSVSGWAGGPFSAKELHDLLLRELDGGPRP